MRSQRPDAPDAADCVCGCPAEAHVHLRPGTDCGRCGNGPCPVYRPVDAEPWRDLPLSPSDQVAMVERPDTGAPWGAEAAEENALWAERQRRRR